MTDQILDGGLDLRFPHCVAPLPVINIWSLKCGFFQQRGMIIVGAPVLKSVQTPGANLQIAVRTLQHSCQPQIIIANL